MERSVEVLTLKDLKNRQSVVTNQLCEMIEKYGEDQVVEAAYTEGFAGKYLIGYGIKDAK